MNNRVECCECDWEGLTNELTLRHDGNHCPECDSGNLFEPNCPSAYMTDEEVEAAVRAVSVAETKRANDAVNDLVKAIIKAAVPATVTDLQQRIARLEQRIDYLEEMAANAPRVTPRKYADWELE